MANSKAFVYANSERYAESLVTGYENLAMSLRYKGYGHHLRG